ncbi:hypothetical protein BDW22DRAFT_894858 [Trametopsis cervina]|nr:hypothetical protein BDW22DRAFT_894858 [Trametopsis cervina]
MLPVGVVFGLTQIMLLPLFYSRIRGHSIMRGTVLSILSTRRGRKRERIANRTRGGLDTRQPEQYWLRKKSTCGPQNWASRSYWAVSPSRNYVRGAGDEILLSLPSGA